MTDGSVGDDPPGASETPGDAADESAETGARAADPPSATASTDRFGSAVDEEWTVSRMVTTMVPLLVALSILQMVSGSVLERFEAVLLTNPALLVLVPVQIGTAGNLGSIMCSRLSTQLHLGTVEFSPSNPAIRANVGAVLALGVTVFAAVGVAAWAIGRALGGTLGLGSVLTISLVSGGLLSAFVVVVSLAAVSTSFRLGFNPDDTTIPVVTNVCDVTGVLILFGVVSVVL